MSIPSRRLSLLKKFERQVAPLEKYHVDILGLCKDTREEIEYLERKKGITGPADDTHRSERDLSISSRSSSEQRTLANDSDHEPRGRTLKRAEALHDHENMEEDEEPKEKIVSENDGAAKNHHQPQAHLRRAKSHREPKNLSWFGIFGKKMHRDRDDHPASTAAPALLRNHSLPPPKPTQENPGKRLRRRLSKKKQRPQFEELDPSTDDPPIHPNTVWNANVPPNPFYDDDDYDDDGGWEQSPPPESPQHHPDILHNNGNRVEEEDAPYIHPDHYHNETSDLFIPPTSHPNPGLNAQEAAYIVHPEPQLTAPLRAPIDASPAVKEKVERRIRFEETGRGDDE
ncbi:MAG: hypothetical protein Q9223_005474, partial [Gallowayella weberi]